MKCVKCKVDIGQTNSPIRPLQMRVSYPDIVLTFCNLCQSSFQQFLEEAWGCKDFKGHFATKKVGTKYFSEIKKGDLIHNVYNSNDICEVLKVVNNSGEVTSLTFKDLDRGTTITHGFNSSSIVTLMEFS